PPHGDGHAPPVERPRGRLSRNRPLARRVQLPANHCGPANPMRILRSYWLGLVLVLIEAPLPAPGQYPGQYPPGNGGLGIPIPRRHKKEEQAQLQSTSGMLRRMLKDQVIVEADDHRILNFKRTGTTHFLKMGNPIKPADLKPGDYIEVESSEDDEGFLTAVN